MSRSSEKRRAERLLRCKYLGDKCLHCGSAVDRVVAVYGDNAASTMEFNHIDPNTKHYDYDNMIRLALNEDQFNELDKCVLLCTGCHRLLTLQRLEGEFTIRAVESGLPIQRTLKVQGILNLETQVLRLFAAEEFALWHCGVKIGRRKERLIPAFELDTAQNLQAWLRAIEKYRKIVIRRMSDGYVFMTVRLNGDRVRIEYDTSISLSKTRLTLIDEDKKTFWVRRGLVIDRKNLTINPSHWFTIECDYKDALSV